MTKPSSQYIQWENPDYCVIKQCFIFCLFHMLWHTLAWGGTGSETSGIHEEDHSCGIAIPAKTRKHWKTCQRKKKKNQTARESLPAWFPSQGDLEKHLNVSEVIQTRPADFHSLFSVWVQPSELRCHWGGSYIWLLISSSDLPTVITYFPITKGCPAVQPTSNCKLKSLILENN